MDNNNPVVAWLQSLPPITRTWFALSFLVTAAVTFDFLSPRDLFFDWNKICNTKKLELWRLVTCFLYAGGHLNEVNALFTLFNIQQQGSALERNPFMAGGNPRADFLFCVLVCMMLTIAGYLLASKLISVRRYLSPLFTYNLCLSITYVWSKRNPNVNINLNHVMPIPGRYLPFAQVFLAYAMGHHIYGMVFGMAVGHVYYWLVDVVPRVLGRQVLRTPSIFVEVVNDVFGEEPEFRRDNLLQNHDDNNNNTQEEATREMESRRMRRRFQQEGATDAHIAAKLGQLDTLREIAAHDDDRQQFGAKDQNDWQPLHEAVRSGHTNCVIFLLDFPDIVDKNARTLNGTGPNALWLAETTHGSDHPITRRLQELGAVSMGPSD